MAPLQMYSSTRYNMRYGTRSTKRREPAAAAQVFRRAAASPWAQGALRALPAEQGISPACRRLAMPLGDRTLASLVAGAGFMGAAAYAYNSVLYGAKDREQEDRRLEAKERKEERKDKQQEARAKVYTSAMKTRDAMKAKLEK